MRRKITFFGIGILAALLMACGNEKIDNTPNIETESESESQVQLNVSEESEHIIQFEEYYAGFHVVAESEYMGGLQERIQLVLSEMDWELWVEENFPEISKLIESDAKYSIDWNTKCLLVHSTYPVSDQAAIMRLIDSIKYKKGELVVTELEEQLVILPADDRLKDERKGVNYYPYQIVIVDKADLTDEICEKYRVTYENQIFEEIEFRNIYMGFHSLKYGDYTAGMGEGVIALITSEDDFDRWWRTYLSEIAVYVLTRAQPQIDWDKEVLIVYHSNDGDRDSVTELHPIENVYVVENELYIRESSQILSMPTYTDVYEYSYQPYQIIAVSKDKIP